MMHVLYFSYNQSFMVTILRSLGLVYHIFMIFVFIYYYFEYIFSFTETGMNEDGSFIGLYGRKGKPQPSNNQAFATLV